MKKSIISAAIFASLLCPSAAKAQQNPILPGFHADPEIVYSNLTHRYYIYSTTDGTPGWGGYTYRCFSSADLKEWRDEGDVLNAKNGQIPWANGNLWAPAIQEVKVGKGKYKYYLYYSANPKAGGGKEIGVAVGNSPTGPFVDYGKSIVNTVPEGCHGQQIDVDVFVDPRSKKPYLYWGNGYMAGAELQKDMTAIKPQTLKVLTPKGGTLKDYAYREAPYVFYRNGTYYFMWSVDDTGSANYHVAYGTAKSPLGPITVAKDPIVLKQDPKHFIFGTAHNSVINVPGTDDWYIVYHRINRLFINADEKPGIHREVCIDRLEFNADGTIKPVKPTHAVTNKDGSIDLVTNGNPLFKHVHTADPAAMVEGDTLWLFPGQDEDDAPANEYKMKNWLAFSTTDLKHWHQYPVPLNVDAFKWADSHQAFAGHVAKYNGKYYWFVSTNWCGIGVAVSDKITGPYKDAIGKPLLTNKDCRGSKHSWACIDPAIFVDDDNTPYIIWGNRQCYIARLKPSMTEIDGEIKQLDLGDEFTFTEAPWVHKYNGKYYLTYATGWPEKIAYAMSDNIMGPWKPMGLLDEMAGNSNTTHPAIVNFKGQWVYFSHNGGLPDGNSYRRSVVMKPLEYNADGTMRLVQK